MKIVENNILPFGGYLAVNIFGILFIHKGTRDKISSKVINHEAIHSAQIKEMLYIFFYLWYGIEYFVRLFQHGDEYLSISLEREAYDNEDNPEYLKSRKHFSWFKYVKLRNI